MFCLTVLPSQICSHGAPADTHSGSSSCAVRHLFSRDTPSSLLRSRRSTRRVRSHICHHTLHCHISDTSCSPSAPLSRTVTTTAIGLQMENAVPRRVSRQSFKKTSLEMAHEAVDFAETTYCLIWRIRDGWSDSEQQSQPSSNPTAGQGLPMPARRLTPWHYQTHAPNPDNQNDWHLKLPLQRPDHLRLHNLLPLSNSSRSIPCLDETNRELSLIDMWIRLAVQRGHISPKR